MTEPTYSHLAGLDALVVALLIHQAPVLGIGLPNGRRIAHLHPRTAGEQDSPPERRLWKEPESSGRGFLRKSHGSIPVTYTRSALAVCHPTSCTLPRLRAEKSISELSETSRRFHLGASRTFHRAP
jgi:hypothetical protein